MLSAIPDAAQSPTRSTDRFRLAVDASRTAPEPARAQRPTQLRFVQGLSASNFAVWVSTSFPATEPMTISLNPPMASDVFLNSVETQFLSQIRADLDELGESLRESAAARLCRQFAEDVGLALPNMPGVRSAVFPDDQGVTLLAHCRPTRRQISFEFHADGRTITVVSIDERMHRAVRPHTIGSMELLRNEIAWLANRF